MAYQFASASTQYLSASAPVTAAPFTIAAWAQRTTINVNQAVASLNQNSGTNRWVLYFDTSNKINFFVNDSGGFAQASSTTSANSTGVWYHTAAVEASASDHRVFLNGGGKGTSTTSRSPASINAVNIGNDRNSNTNTSLMNGLIADVAIWNVALSDAEVASLAKGFSAKTVQPGNLVFYAPLVRELIDYSGSLTITNNNTATVANHPRIYV